MREGPDDDERRVLDYGDTLLRVCDIKTLDAGQWLNDQARACVCFWLNARDRVDTGLQNTDRRS